MCPDPGSQNVTDPTDPDPKHCLSVSQTRFFYHYTVDSDNQKQLNMKTTLYQYLSVFDAVTKKIVS